jgi:hypothetical protein
MTHFGSILAPQPIINVRVESLQYILYVYGVPMYWFLKKVDITYHHLTATLIYAIYPSLNARNMYKDEKYCRRLNAWNDCISRDFACMVGMNGQKGKQKKGNTNVN